MKQLCRAAPAGPVQRQGGFDFRQRRAGEPEEQKKERRGRKGGAEERASKHQQSSRGKERGGRGGGAAGPSLNPANRGTGKGAKGTADAR